MLGDVFVDRGMFGAKGTFRVSVRLVLLMLGGTFGVSGRLGAGGTFGAGRTFGVYK